MKRFILPVCFTAVIAVCLFFCNSCEKYILPELSLDQDTITVPISGGEYNITFTSNVKWTIDESSAGKWLRFSEITGSSDYQLVKYEITLTVDANETGAARSQSVPITTTSLSKSIFVQQDGPESSEEDSSNE